MLWDRRLEDLKNFFTQKELLLFVDALKNVDELPGHIPPGRFLIDTVRYKIEEERYAIKWGVDQQVVMRNLEWADTEPLTMVVLTVWAWAGTHGNHGKNRYDYVKELTS